MTLPIGEPRTAGRRVVRRRFVPHNVGRMKVALPNGLTLGNLFFGINAIIAASRGNFNHACLFVVLGGVCDAFDGAAARATRTGGRFGEELDSLVDAISFGLAPAMIVHFSTLATGNAGWNVAVFVFAACAVMRLARFNITQAGGSKTYFQGLPSPAAGGTLATYWWFSQTSFYQNNAAIVDLPWNLVMQGLMLALGFLMVSDVPYPAWPKIGLRSWKGVLGLAGMLFLVFGIAYWRSAFFFPFGIAYVTYGLVRMLVLGMWERRPRRDAYTGLPFPRRGTPRSTSILPPDVEELDASDLLDPDDLAEEEYDFFDDEEEDERPARPARPSGGMRVVKPGRPDRPERTAAERADREERLEKRKKRKRKERLEQRAAQERGESRDETRPPRGAAQADQPSADRPAASRGEPRPPRPPRDVPRPERQDRPGLAEAATAAGTEGDDAADMEGGDEPEMARDGAPRGDGERRKRRKRRRGNRQPGESPTTMDVAPDAGSGSPERAQSAMPLPVTPPFVAPAPAPATPPPTPPAAPAPPPFPSQSFESREDRSE